MPPPLGTLVHAFGHNWLGKVDIVVQTVLLAVGLIAVGLRLWSRRLRQNSLQTSDWLIITAVVRDQVTSASPSAPRSITLTTAV